MDTNIRICGEAGQGVQTTGDLLTHALAAAGLHVCATQGYMSRIRGGVNSFDVRASDAELFGARVPAELLVAFTREALLALFRAGDEKGQTTAVAWLADPGTADARDLAIRCVQELGLKEHLPTVRRYLADRNEPTRIAAIVALSQWKDAESRPAFEEASKSKAVRIGRAGQAALQLLDGKGE